MQCVWRVLRENLGVLVLAAIMGALYLYLRTPATAVKTEADFTALFAAGKPVLVELYSNT